MQGRRSSRRANANTPNWFLTEQTAREERITGRLTEEHNLIVHYGVVRGASSIPFKAARLPREIDSLFLLSSSSPLSSKEYPGSPIEGDRLLAEDMQEITAPLLVKHFTAQSHVLIRT